MDWRERAAEGLPAPRGDEPTSLRQDILDELADHLDCALKRELTKNITPDEAVENVKRRFGDPRDLARRLWLDATKDTIMSKRLTLVAMGLMFVMCLLLGWMAWTSQRASQEAAESIRKTNSEFLEKFTTLLARPTPGAAAERLPVRFHLFHYDGHNSPAQGFEAAFYPQGAGGTLNALKRTSDARGDLDFGKLPPGAYFLDLTAPWHETTRIPLDVTPGFPISSPIACPAEDWRRVEVSFEFPGLPSLTDRDALIICRIAAQRTRQIKPGGFAWFHGDFGAQPTEESDVVIDPKGRVVYCAKALATYPQQSPLWANLTLNNGRQGGGAPFQMLALTERFAWLADGLKQPHPADFVECRYSLKWIAVVLAPDIRRMAGQVSEQAGPHTLLTWEAGKTPFVCGNEQDGVMEAPAVDPVVGRKNVWKVHVMPSLAQRVERMLLASASRISEPANDAESTEATAGAEWLKALGIESAVAERTPDGLTGLRLKVKSNDSLALQAGLQTGDLLLGINGWNVNDDRELGWVSKRRPRINQPKNTEPGHGGFPIAPPVDPRQQDSLVTLVRRASDVFLFGVGLTDSPKLDPSKSTGGGGFPAGRFRQRVPVSDP
ncbi:MAG TPA: hypothetical protein VG055_01360 [Planctomycetaceae bacterium]|jgi:hypothetical protein|nr:hypothetical protein [Planctomycetaceae bacterium]